VVSHIVAQRTNEFGIRMALGARQGDVLRLVLRSTMAMVACGLVVGVICSFALSHALAARWLALGVQPTSSDPRILAGVIVLLAATAAAACLLPAQRASSIDPMVALRFE
jgi:ABC-type antimicrobial peptide transport system permease subunit